MPARRIALYLAVLMAAPVGFASAAMAGQVSSAPSGCRLYVNDPGSGLNVWAGIGRTGCSGNATLTSELKREVSWAPDPVDIRLVGNGVNFTAVPNEPCAAHGQWTYYGSAHSSGGTDLDGHHEVECSGIPSQ